MFSAPVPLAWAPSGRRAGTPGVDAGMGEFMSDLSQAVVVGQLEAVLKEAFEGSPGSGSYFTDSGPEGGFFGTLAGLGAPEASRPFGGSTIAAHVHHVVFSLEASASWIRGERIQRDWNASWKVSLVDAAEWSRLQQDLRARYEELIAVVRVHAADGEDAFGGTVGAVAHMADHLGAIRQKVAYGRHG